MARSDAAFRTGRLIGKLLWKVGLLQRAPTPRIETPAPIPISPPKTGVEALGTYLAARRIEQEAEEREERERLQRLESLWAGVSPAVAKAVELVNAQLAPHGMTLSLSDPEFFGSPEAPDGFGVACRLNSAAPMAYNGKQYVVVTEKCLYVGGSNAWSDGGRFTLCEPQASAIADTIADTARSLLEG